MAPRTPPRPPRPWSVPAVAALVLLVPPRLVTGGETGGATPPPPTAAEIVESRSSYQSQGKAIAVERFEPRAPGKYPGVVVLHGSGGMLVGGPAFRELARELARRGYVAHVVHYFDLTGTYLADRPMMEKNFPGWLLAVADGVSDLSRRPNVDPARVGVAGYSLGGYMAVALALFDPRVSGVVDFFGGLPEPLRGDVKSLPPTLILHGDADRIVPVAEARTLESVCRARNVPYEMRVYTGQGHFFTGDDHRDSVARALRFLDTHVKQTPTRHEVARPKFDLLPSGTVGASTDTLRGIGAGAAKP